MEQFNQFIGQNYYTVYDQLQALAQSVNLNTSLVESNLDFNIDIDPTRLKIFVNYESFIIGFKQE
jgi:hypothetical protein